MKPKDQDPKTPYPIKDLEFKGLEDGITVDQAVKDWLSRDFPTDPVTGEIQLTLTEEQKEQWIRLLTETSPFLRSIELVTPVKRTWLQRLSGWVRKLFRIKTPPPVSMSETIKLWTREEDHNTHSLTPRFKYSLQDLQDPNPCHGCPDVGSCDNEPVPPCHNPEP